MQQKLQAVRGTQDYLPEISLQFRYIDHIAYETAKLFSFEEIDTPIFEFSEVFHRTLGETSDTVSKETYTFQDRGGDELTLRPEGTAGIVRAFISNGLAQNLPLKYYYSGPMFRYERPQKGRYRQFHQIGVECLGFESATADVECLALSYLILKKLGVEKKSQLEINTLGDHESRAKHRALLVEYLKDFENKLSDDSKIRLQKNPLRILDSKDINDQKILENAPLLKSCLNQVSQDFFGEVLEGLEVLDIPFILNQQLVRGLDYYTHTVFEFTTTLLGAQSAILAGGRYDGLVELMGGPKAPSIGWAAGMERLALLIDSQTLASKTKLSAIIAADTTADVFCLKLANDLRAQNIACELIIGNNMGKKMKRANKIGANFALIVGETELKINSVMIKDLNSGNQNLLPVSEIAPILLNS